MRRMYVAPDFGTLTVNVAGGHPASQTIGVEVAIAGHEVGDIDLRRVLDQGQVFDATPDRRLIHSIPVGYTIDGSRGIRDPRGMYGERLGVDMHVVTAAALEPPSSSRAL